MSSATVRGAIYRVGPNYCIDVPSEVMPSLEAGGGYVAVVGRVGARVFRTRLTSRTGGGYRLFLNGEVRDDAGVGEGDAIEVEVRAVDEAEPPSLPPDLREALADLDGGLEAFEGLTAAQRSGMVAFLERARTDETRARYVERIIDEVRARMR